MTDKPHMTLPNGDVIHEGELQPQAEVRKL